VYFMPGEPAMQDVGLPIKAFAASTETRQLKYAWTPQNTPNANGDFVRHTLNVYN
jgi:hypothetical protein